MTNKKHNYRADRQRLEAHLDKKIFHESLNTPTPMVNVSAPDTTSPLPNAYAAGFNAGREARAAIGEINQHNED